jgi:hypothetical protein
MVRGMLAAGGLASAAEAAGGDVVVRTIVNSLSRYRTDDGRYRLVNEWHYVVARASQGAAPASTASA